MALSLLHDDEFFNLLRGYRFPLGWPVNAAPSEFVEYDNRYEIVCDCPGFAPGDLSIEEKDHYLNISGASSKKSFQRQFTRSFYLPENADEKRIDATLEHGVLTVSIPKTERKQKPVARKISIRSS